MAFLRPYARGAWHWFALDALLSLLAIGAGLAAPALAARGYRRGGGRPHRMGVFKGLAVAMVLSVIVPTSSPNP